MASQIKIQSFNQFLGALIRTIVANTPLNDVNQGSVLLTLLEAVAANDFENNAAILSLLNLLNIDTVSGSDLDSRAADFGLTRKPATKSSGSVSIFNTSITKQSTSLYVIKPAPIQGQTVLFVNNTAGWTASGTLYVGRGTTSFEGPIAYSSINVFPTYSQINLSSALQNNHLISDTVINAQAQPDRIITAGTITKIPANNQNPEIDYVTLRDAILPAGETQVDNVAGIALVAGSIGNAPINTIIQFSTAPFAGAGVSNTSAFSGGFDVETDQELRDRIKSYTNTLARGTEAAILAAVIGVSDSSDSNQVASAIIAEAPSLGQPAILYIDDGHGFQPSYAGQSVDTLLTNATGKEQFLQLANYPVTRPQAINTGIGPFVLADGSSLKVSVTGAEETIFFSIADFVNISAAQVAEVVVAINKQATKFSARLTNNSANILLYPDAFDAEIIKVAAEQPLDNPSLYANNVLQFPTAEFSFISLYQNSTRLREKTITAQVETSPFASWNITGTGDLTISVDNTPEQDRAFNLSNFPGASTFASLTLADWVQAFNNQFAGITATATSNQTMQINSNQSGAGSALAITGGTYLAQLFPTQATTSVGQTGQFILNRQTGNLEILTTIKPGDSITAGTTDAKGFVISAVTLSGTYNVSSDASGRAAQMIVVPDSTYCNQRAINTIVGSTIAISSPSTDVMRIMSNLTDAFSGLLPGDFIYITQRAAGWLSAGNTGLFKIVDKGSHITAGVDTYVDVMNPAANIVPETVSVADTADVQAFSTDGYPQLWLGVFTPNPPIATINDVVDSINNDLVNVLASVYQSTTVKVTSTTENGGSIAIPVVMGNATALFTSTKVAQFGNPSQVAAIVSDKTLLTYFKMAKPSEANTWLDRQTYVDSKGPLTADAIPDSFPWTGPYSEIITSAGILNTSYVDYDSIVSFTRGNNRHQIRSVAALLGGDECGTQEALARTSLDHTVGDEFEIVKPMELSSSDTVVVVVDEDPQNNTINIPLSRTGQVNSGSNSMSFIPTTTEFSANDYDNQPGIDFSNPNVWSTTLNHTNFSDYAVWSRARNWYSSGGVGAGKGVMIIRAVEYGPNGNFLRFNIQYPTVPSQVATTSFVNTPSFTTFSYFFGSGIARPIGLSGGNTITVKGPYPDTATNFPNGVVSSGNYFDYTFSAGDLSSVLVGDVLSIMVPAAGVSSANSGQFSVKNINTNTVRVFNPSGTNTVETISNPAGVNTFPLTGTTVAAIAATINSSALMSATPVGSSSLTITVSTEDESYAYSGNSTALGYGHNPTSPSLRGFVGMYDGINWVKSFENPNPNFTLKTAYILQGVAPSVYSMDTAPNFDTVTNGELFKLVPTTVQNLYHQFTQKALSQLPIVTTIDITDDRKKVQIKSNKLGSAGAIEFVGGTGNQSKMYIQAEAEVDTDGSGSYLLVKVPAFPDTFSVGDTVLLQNNAGVERLNRLQASDTVDVLSPSTGTFDYVINPKVTGIASGTSFTIVDVSASYGIPTGFIWRWTATGGGVSFSPVNPGDLLYAFGSLSSAWDQNNRAKPTGDAAVSGLPIVAVNVGSNYVDVVNPFGIAMSATTVGSGSVHVSATSVIQWTLAHAAYVNITSLSRTANVVSVVTTTPHFLNSGNSVSIRDSVNIPDGVYASITVTSPNQFTFALAGANFTETSTFASLIKSTLTQTRYRMESLGFNGLMRLSRQDGQSPSFKDSGVAVDDYILLKGTTFASNNNGRFRVLAVDDNSVIFLNPIGTDQLNTVRPMNNSGIDVVFTANTNYITGPVGAFKYVQVGDWVKKQSDPDTSYLQVVSLNNISAALATQINLGGTYTGSTNSAIGVVYREASDYDKGVFLQNAYDVSIFEGDAAVEGDTLFVQNIVDANWFNINNVGSYSVVEYGTEATTYRPFIRVSNAKGVTQTGVQVSVNLGGFYLVESLANKFYSIREVEHTVLDDVSSDLRDMYIYPFSRSYKFSPANFSSVTHLGKLGYGNNTVVGIDGYTYYTGLLQKVQRIVDGYEPDAADFPGQKAVGSAIEVLPPLPFQVNLALNIVTNEGANLGEVSNNVKSAIIDYVEGLAVGAPIILSQIIADVQPIRGVASVTFTKPVPSTQSITLASNEKAIISSSNISIA